MRAGLLREKIVIQRPATVKDAYGANTIEWEDTVTTRARATYNNGNRKNENNEIIFPTVVTFVIRRYHNVEENDRILWMNNKYRIQSINRQSDRQEITIITELINE